MSAADQHHTIRLLGIAEMMALQRQVRNETTISRQLYGELKEHLAEIPDAQSQQLLRRLRESDV